MLIAGGQLCCEPGFCSAVVSLSTEKLSSLQEGPVRYCVLEGSGWYILTTIMARAPISQYNTNTMQYKKSHTVI